MLEVMFSDSLSGAMRQAKGRKKGQRTVAQGVQLFIEHGDDGEMLRHWTEPAEVETVWEADLPGTAGDVAPLVLALDMGDLSDMDTVEKEKRRELLLALEGDLCPEKEARRKLEMTMETNQSTLDRLERAKQSKEEVRVWIADWCPADVCGLYWVCDLLRDAEVPVSLVRAPREKVRSDGTLVTYRGLGEFLPEELGELAAGAVPLEPIRRRAYANRWRELVAENAPLRAVVNGQLMSVEEDHYDFALRAVLPEKPVRAANVLGDALSRLPGVGDVWLYGRILAMLAAGELREITPGDPDRPYSAVIARV